MFTLGSFAVTAAGGFYAEAAAAARLLGRRALVLTGPATPPCHHGDILSLPYAPHSAVFPRAAAVIHHGGVGTTGQALRAGRPQLVVPLLGDQFDNADRLRAAGLAHVIRREGSTAAKAAEALARALADPPEARIAAAAIVAGEDGATTAARHIAALT